MTLPSNKILDPTHFIYRNRKDSREDNLQQGRLPVVSLQKQALSPLPKITTKPSSKNLVELESDYSTGGESGTCLNGVCYWLSSYRGTKEAVIFPFHLGDEMSREIVKVPVQDKYGLSLGIYNESLSLLHMDSDVTKCVDMWVMNQGLYAVGSSYLQGESG
ncbi:hypothetical protein Dsin_024329 [Dipteronia sinensis]|uniref:F-box associated beta-propeller type 1 domain-containing protein n=1 Tax=Dipteronia sinensis TaxID=43782 RepID=A0AAD9ZUX7_9ROSI|nr:hypothetical protein Dsin_024329 [Dipteronia sinensis]